MCCQRRGGGKRILAPHGGELTPPTKREPDGTPLKAAARAWRQQKWLDARDNPHVVNASVPCELEQRQRDHPGQDSQTRAIGDLAAHPAPLGAAPDADEQHQVPGDMRRKDEMASQAGASAARSASASSVENRLTMPPPRMPQSQKVRPSGSLPRQSSTIVCMPASVLVGIAAR